MQSRLVSAAPCWHFALVGKSLADFKISEFGSKFPHSEQLLDSKSSFREIMLYPQKSAEFSDSTDLGKSQLENFSFTQTMRVPVWYYTSSKLM